MYYSEEQQEGVLEGDRPYTVGHSQSSYSQPCGKLQFGSEVASKEFLNMIQQNRLLTQQWKENA